MYRSTPGLPVHHHLPELTQTHVHGVGDAIQPSHPLSSPFPPAPNPSQQSPFQWVNSSHEVAKYWSFSFSIIPSKEHPGLISFRMDWLDLFAVQGILKSLLQHHCSSGHTSVSLWTLSHKSHLLWTSYHHDPSPFLPPPTVLVTDPQTNTTNFQGPAQTDATVAKWLFEFQLLLTKTDRQTDNPHRTCCLLFSG